MFTIENTFSDYPEIVSVKQMQMMLKICRNKAYALIDNGDIKTVRIGRVHKIPKINIIDYLNKNNH